MLVAISAKQNVHISSVYIFFVIPAKAGIQALHDIARKRAILKT